MSKESVATLAPRWQRIADEQGARNVIAWSSLLFAVLQSICTFFAALDGLRLGLGLTSLVLAASTAAAIDRFHVDWLRIPMISLAVTGSLINLAILWQIRRLRKQPAALWRQTAPSPRKVRMERLQLILSIAALILIGFEERQHLIWLHHL